MLDKIPLSRIDFNTPGGFYESGDLCESLRTSKTSFYCQHFYKNIGTICG